jgi:dipeptidyl-peptidase-4
MIRIRKSIAWRGILVLIFCIVIGPVLFAEHGDENESLKDITLDYLYKKNELGIKPVDPDLPRSLQWSEEGHILAYLVSFATEAPHLVLYNPAKDATAFLVTPFALHDALIELASQPQGVAIAPSSQPRRIPEDATTWKKIDGYDWTKKENRIRLHVEGKKYLWQPEENVLQEETRPQLPGGEKNDVEFSPNERYAAYTRANDIYVYDLQQKKEFRVTFDGGDAVLNGRMTWVYWEELHYRRSWRAFYWSPNSDALAYLQFNETGVSVYPVTDFSSPVPTTRNMYYPKAGTKNPDVRLGVVSLSTRDTRWIDLGEPYEYINDVSWRPDGKTLAVQVLNRAQTQLRVLFANPIDGSSRIVLEENDAVWINVMGGPFFLERQDDFLWLSERDGYRHLYRYSGDGKKVKQLTNGEWEVNPSLWRIAVDLDENHHRVYFNATEKSPLETHVYSVSLNGGKLQRLTQEEGSHNIDLSADRKFALDSLTSLTVPRKIQVLDHRGRVIRILGETTIDEYAPYRIKSAELLELQGPNHLTFYARMLKPFNFNPNQTYPVILHVYGGPAGQVAEHTFTSEQDMAFVNRGFILFSFDTRGTPGRGKKWLNAIHRNTCDKPLEDLHFAVDYLKSLPYVDGDRIGVWGWSNGGYMTCAAMLKAAGLFRAGAAVAPVTDWRLYDTVYTERYMGDPDENQEGYKESAPIHYAEKLQGKLLIAHGVSDDNVHIQNVYSLVDKLLEAEKPYELYVYPQRDHGIGGDKRRYHLFDRILDFFERELAAK